MEHLLKTVVPKDKKVWIWRAMGRKALALNRARVKWQMNTDGSDFEKRADGSDKPMLKKTLRGKGKGGPAQVSVEAYADSGIVKSLNPVNIDQHFGSVKTVKAMTHRELELRQKDVKGYRDRYNQGKRKGLFGKLFSAETDPPCSLEQARVLKNEVGFKKVSFDGGKTKVRATFANLQKAFTANTAGFIIREHRIKKGKRPKTSWSIKVPPRDVLGISKQDEKILMKYMATLIKKYAYFDISMPPGYEEELES